MKYLPAIILTLTLTACGGEEELEETGEETGSEVCLYSYDAASTEATWTAYKFTNRAGVSATFDQLEINTRNGKEKPIDVLLGAQFNINTMSANTANPARDVTITENFFAALANNNISGVINSADNGSGSMSIMMNGVQNEVPFTYTIDDLTISLEASVNMDDFGCADARQALNEVCYELHIGEEGKSVLWPDVTIAVTTTLVRSCD